MFGIRKREAIPAVFGARPLCEQALNIRGEDAKTTENKLAGGWLVDLAAYPDKVGIVREWLNQAAERSGEFLFSDPDESERWNRVAMELAKVMAHTNAVRAMREKRQAPGDEGVMHPLVALRRGDLAVH